MPKQHKKEKKSHVFYRLVMILVGAAFAAASIELFLVPNNIIDGGIIGISLILSYLFKHPLLNFSTFVVLLNIPFLYFGYKQIGKTFMFSSLFGIVCLAVLEHSFQQIGPFTDQPVLAAVFGGLLLGLGVGLVIRHGGTLDGTEILGILMMKRLPFSVGEFVMFINVFIFGWAAFVLGAENAMYSVMTYYIAFKAIDTVIQGLEETKACIIISDFYEEMADVILHRLGRGTTKLKGKGGSTDSDKEVLYVVVTRLEVTKLKSIINDVDPDAFLTVMNTHETRGGHFKTAIH